tara:strand:+ start:3090 stop:3263 length:174 start_codon:yes stop_codon:yes gene_type:complete
MDFIFYKQVTDNIDKLRKLGEKDLADTYKNELLTCKSEKDFWKIHAKIEDEFFILGA